MTRESKKGRTVKKWKPASPTIKNAIFQVLAGDFAKPKRFSKMWKFVRDRTGCSKVTFWVYLEWLENEGLITKSEEPKIEDKRCLHVYALSDWKRHEEYQKDYNEIMVSDVEELQKKVEKEIMGIEEGILTEREVSDFVFCMLPDFEARELQGFKLLLMGKPIAPFIAPSLIEHFIAIACNLKIQLLSVCFGKYPKATMEAIELLEKNKQPILQRKEYKDILLKLGIEG